MAKYNLNHVTPAQANLATFLNWAGKYWFQLILVFLVLHMYRNDDFQISIDFAGKKYHPQRVQVATGIVPADEETKVSNKPAPDVSPIHLLEDKPASLAGQWKSSDFKNLSFIFNPSLAKEKGVDEAIVKEKLQACRSYVERFAKTAMEEQKKYNIPASITLAQGLLETDAGASRLATESNNHFGIKCRSKCRGCTCRNYSDDDVYDMFRVFDSAWGSYREHSLLLSTDRYHHLKKHGTKNYKAWAEGLKKAGYATDKNYHKKLIRIIEALDLHQFDK